MKHRVTKPNPKKTKRGYRGTLAKARRKMAKATRKANYAKQRRRR